MFSRVVPYGIVLAVKSDKNEQAPHDYNLRLRQFDDGTWSVDVEDLAGNTVHSEAGFASQAEAERAGTVWSARQVALRAVRDALAADGESER